MGQVWPLFFDACMCRGAIYDYGWAKHAGLSRTGMVYVCAVADFVCFGWFFLLSACADQMECGTYLRHDALLYDRQI